MRNRHPIGLRTLLAFTLLLLCFGLALWGALGIVPFAQNATAPRSAAAPLEVAGLAPHTPLAPYAAYLRDPSGQLTVAELAAPDQAARFVPMAGVVPNLGVTGDTVWVRLALSNPTGEPAPVILNVDAPTTSYLDLYTGPPTDGEQPVYATGARRPYDTRPLAGRTFALPLVAPPDATTDYYLRFNSDIPLQLRADIWRPAAFYASSAEDEIQWGIVLGMLLLMCAYNMLLFVTLRDPLHLVLVAFGLAVAASSAVASGYASRWLSPGLAAWWPELTILCIALVIGAFATLALSFLELRQRLRPAWWVLQGCLALVAIAVAAGARGAFQLAYTLLISALLVILVVMYAATIIRVRQGSRLALFFLIGQTAPIVYGIIQSLSILGVGPKLPASALLVPGNSLLLLVIMSLALADRVNLLRKEADQANAALSASERRLNAYLDALPFNIQVHDAQLRPLYVNSAIRQAGQDYPAGWFEADYDLWLREVPVVVSGTGQPYPIEQLPLMRAASGEKAHADDIALQLLGGQAAIEAWSVPMLDEQGQVTAIVTAFQDITERRAVETELANYRDTLEERVAKRTAELTALNANLGARVAELTAINDVGRRVARIVDLEATLDEVLRILTDVFQVTGAAISLFDATAHTVQIVVMADRDEGQRRRFSGRSFPYDFAAGYASQHQNPIVFSAPEQLRGLSPEIHAAMRQMGIAQVLAAPLVAREQHLGALALFGTDSGRVFTADELRVAQTLAGQVATAIDTARLIEEVRQQRDVAEALRQTATALSRNLDQQNAFGAILEQLDQVFACDGAALALMENQELVTVAAKGLSANCIDRRIPLDGADAGLTVLRTRQPSIVADVRATDVAVCCQETQPIRSWLGVPLISGEGVIGVLSLDSIQPNNFSPAQAELLTTFADQAAIAVVNARLYAQAQATAVAGERNRLARDLHDAVTQTIFSASLIASSLPARLPDLAPAAEADLAALQVLTKGALAEMRTLLLELRPEHLKEVALETLLTQLAQAFSGRTGTPAGVHASCDPAMVLPYAIKLVFYRVAQEALNNVAKHAKAACVTIRYSTRPGSVHLAVIDDGRGFAVQSVGPGQLGLAIMQERAAAVGAQLTVDSEPGLGTHLFLVWNDDNNFQAV